MGDALRKTTWAGGYGSRIALRLSGTTANLAFVPRDDVHQHPRGMICPSSASSLVPSRKERAQGRPDATIAPAASCARDKRRKHTSEYRYAETFRPSLRNGFAAYSALSPVSGLLATVARRVSSANLIPASEDQDHTPLPSVSAAFVNCADTSIAPHPTFVTTAKRPS